MTKEREALKLALEALEELNDTEQTYAAIDRGDAAITAIKEALAQPEQDALTKGLSLIEVTDTTVKVWPISEETALKICLGREIYTSPPKREWVGLTDDEINTAWKKWIGTERANKSYTLAIEAKLKEKNT